MKRHALFLLSSLTIAACGGSSTPDETRGTAGGETVVDPLAGRLPPAAADTTPTELPRDLVAVVRLGAIAPTMERVRTLLRLPADTTLDADLRGWIGTSELAAKVDQQKGMDVAILVIAGEPKAVLAFDGGSMRELVAAIPESIATEPLADGSLLVHDRAGDSDVRECALQPTSLPTRTRIVCAKDLVELENARAYLGRNFPTAVETGHVTFELAVDAIRARYASDARSGLMIAGAITDTLLIRASSDDDVPEAARMLLRDPAVRAKIEVIAHDVIDDTGAMITDLRSVVVDGRVEGDAVHFTADVRVPSASGSILRAFARAFRGTAAVPDDMIARLPPGGAVYASGQWDGAPFEEIGAEVRELITAIVASDTRVTAAERDTLDRLLAVAMRPQAYVYATASGTDQQAQTWGVSVVRYADETSARATVDATRQLMAALRRPSIARAFDRYFESLGADRPRMAQIADVRANGVPSGSYAVRFPAFERLVTRIVSESTGVPVPEMPTATNRTVLMIPSGRDLLVVQATDAVAVYRGLTSAGGLSSDIRTPLAEAGWSMTAAIRLGNVRIPGSVDHESGARTLESVLGTEAGQAVSIVRFRDSGTSDDVHFEWSADVPGALIRGIAEAD